ncbi:MAG: hypothetical protein WDW38_010080 [Sanguina aurantia]
MTQSQTADPAAKPIRAAADRACCVAERRGRMRPFRHRTPSWKRKCARSHELTMWIAPSPRSPKATSEIQRMVIARAETGLR